MRDANTTPTIAATGRHNKFQLDRRVLRRLLRRQLNVSGTCPTAALNGHWRTSSDTFSFRIVKVNADLTGPYVATALCDDGHPLLCTPSLLLRTDVTVRWRHASDDFLSRAELCDRACATAYERAQHIAAMFIDTRDGQDEAGRVGDEDVTICTFDGRGSNRRAFRSVYTQRGRPCPRIVTFECDAVPALCQRILYGEDIVYTAGNPTVRSRRVKTSGRGGTPRARAMKVVIEDLIRRDALRAIDPASVGLLYLDYCGGPPTDADMTKILSKFVNLTVYAATVSTRQHAHLDDTFERYIPLLYGFERKLKFSSNRRVRCHVFARTAVPRSVSIPGYFWENCPKKLCWNQFEGVMVTEDTASVHTERGQELVYLSAPARKRFCK